MEGPASLRQWGVKRVLALEHHPPPAPSMSLTMGRLDSWMSQEQSSQLVGRLASCPGARSGRGQRNVSLHCQMPPIPRPVLTCSYWSCLPGPGLTGDHNSCHVVSWPPKPEVVILYPTFLFLTLPGGSPDATSLKADSPHPDSRCGWGTQTIVLWTPHPVLTPCSQPCLQH